MSSSEIPENVRRLLAECIRSVSQLEVLLLLMRESASEWTAERVASGLYIQPQPAAEHLQKLFASGLLARGTGDQAAYRYAPASSDRDRAVRDLAQIYSVMRLRVINEIMSNPDDSIQSFADAFKFKKDKD